MAQWRILVFWDVTLSLRKWFLVFLTDVRNHSHSNAALHPRRQDPQCSSYIFAFFTSFPHLPYTCTVSLSIFVKKNCYFQLDHSGPVVRSHYQHFSMYSLFIHWRRKQQVFLEPWYLSSARLRCATLRCATSHITLIAILASNLEIVVFILRSLDCNINGNLSCTELNAVQHPGVTRLNAVQHPGVTQLNAVQHPGVTRLNAVRHPGVTRLNAVQHPGVTA